MKRVFIFLFGVCLCALPARGGEIFRFGVCLSLTGGMQESGNAYLAGVRMRVDEHNAALGPGGVRLEAVVRDDASDAATAAAIVEELAVGEGVSAIVGPTSSGLVAAMRPNAVKHGVVVISPSATNPDIGKNGDWMFRVLFDDAFQGRVLARFVTERLAATRVGVVANRLSPYGKSFWESFRRTAVENGAVVAAEEWYEWDAKTDDSHDFAANLRMIKTARPDVTLLPNYSWEVAEIVRQSLVEDVKTVFCGGDTWQNENVMLESGYNLENGYFVAGRNIDFDAPEMRHYVRLYDMSNDLHVRANSFQAYDAVSLLIEAMKNGRDGAAIRDGLYAIRDFPLASGPITIDRVKGTIKPGCVYRVEMIDEVFAPVFVEEVLP